MENFNIQENPELTEELRKLKTTDPAHADVFNTLFEKLLNNDIYLNRLADAMVKKEDITHNIKEADPEKVAGADVTAELYLLHQSLPFTCEIMHNGDGFDINKPDLFGIYSCINLNSLPAAIVGWTNLICYGKIQQAMSYSDTGNTMYIRHYIYPSLTWTSWRTI